MQHPLPAPWPCMRGNIRNDGRAAYRATLRPELAVRRFKTGNAVFSTPVIGADETVYVGSADKTFYAFDPLSGAERWKFQAGEVIDSAACIGPDGTVFVPGGDAKLYALTPQGKELWHVDLLKESDGFSPSTIYWLEANVAMGPTGWLYFGCDNFRFYAVEPGKGIRWSHLTGLHLWSCPAFPDERTVVVPSFDMHVYAFDARSGKTKWKSDLGNFIASSPAVGPDGTLYLGSFDRHIYALDGKTGRKLWSVETGGAVYASAAVAADGMLYAGSHDGRIYAIDTHTKKIRWTHHTPSPIHSSAALGVDPEGKAEYLIYVGGGDGCVYALDPDGVCRWSFDTLGGDTEAMAHAVNASIALGHHGLAAATAGGDVVYIPYDAYLKPKAAGFRKHKKNTDAVEILAVAADGKTYPLKNGHRVSLAPGNAMSLRIVADDAWGERKTAELRMKGLTLETAGRKDLPMRTLLSPDATLLHLLPDPHAAPGRYVMNATLPYKSSRAWKTAALQFEIDVAEVQDPAPASALPTFRIRHMLVSSPPIVASFDQIGIASLSMDVRIVHHDAASGAIVAWGVQKFGIDEHGAAVGVPYPRFAVYAFGGTYRNGVLSLCAKNCQFEITAFQVPLDRLQFTLTADGTTLQGGTMLAEVRIRDMMSELLPPRIAALPGMLSRLLPQTVPSAAKSFHAALQRLSPGKAAGRLGNTLVGMGQIGSVSLRILLERTWSPWGLFSDDGECRTLGTFRAEAVHPKKSELWLKEFH
ncbi:MAG TPA: PQQ-binding-like beta-propeller repeat protein, partial [Candidatus Peribacteria bacterium]|nr:PQQ-binding-like beta-propeller repeat protein [Candidatus Peribacteria bacterium]